MDKIFISSFFCSIFSVNGSSFYLGNRSHCNITCGMGKQIRVRSCNDPAPFGRGDDCVGPSYEARDCNEVLCPGKTFDFAMILLKSKGTYSNESKSVDKGS